ncbi:UBP46 hydrolase, partial [Polypterus senegalus]
MSLNQTGPLEVHLDYISHPAFEVMNGHLQRKGDPINLEQSEENVQSPDRKGHSATSKSTPLGNVTSTTAYAVKDIAFVNGLRTINSIYFWLLYLQSTVLSDYNGSNASALVKDIGPEQFPINEHYFGLVNIMCLIQDSMSNRSIDTRSSQWYPRIFLRDTVPKESSLRLRSLDSIHVSQPYSKTGSTRTLKT